MCFVASVLFYARNEYDDTYVDGSTAKKKKKKLSRHNERTENKKLIILYAKNSFGNHRNAYFSRFRNSYTYLFMILYLRVSSLDYISLWCRRLCGRWLAVVVDACLTSFFFFADSVSSIPMLTSYIPRVSK